MANLSMVERSYSQGIMPDRGIARRRQGETATQGLTAEVSEVIASHPDRYPMEFVGLAEAFCKETVSSHISPVAVVAGRDKWFVTD